jgi:hypothetical protein
MKKQTIFAIILVTLFTALCPAVTIRWLGTATAVAQVDSMTVGGTVETTDIFTLTATGLDGTTFAISYTAAAGTTTDVTAGLTSLWNSSVNSLMTPITATDNDPVVTLTADTAGDAFSVAATEADGGGNDTQTFIRSAVTASAGPKHWDSAANWSTGAVPDGAHDVFVEDFSGDILFGLDQSAITTLTTLTIGKSFTGKIGSNGSAGIAADYLQIKATNVNIGRHLGPGSPAGSGRIKLDTGATASTITVDGTATASDTGKPSLRLKTASSSSNLYVNKGSVGLAHEAGETSTIGTVRVGFLTNVSSDSDLFLGDGVTFAGTNTLDITGGDVSLRSAVTTVTISGGSLVKTNSGAITTLNAAGGSVSTWDSGTITTLNASGSRIDSNSTGTIATLTITGGTVDFTKSPAARTVSDATLDSGGTLKYDPSIVTMTAQVDSASAVTLTATN